MTSSATTDTGSLVYKSRQYVSSQTVAAFIAGGIAGAVSRTVVSPLERLKILYQVQGSGGASYTGIGASLGKMWKEEGWRGFLRGNGTNCIRIVPYSAVQFSSYTIYKDFLMEEGQTQLNTQRRLLAGGMAGVTSVVATYPLDICRTRLSIHTASLEALGKTGQHLKIPGMWETMVHMYKHEGGVLALYRGLIPTLAGVAPYVGLNFACYEQIREWMTPPGEKSPGPLGKLACGAMSGAIAQTFTYPFDLLRRRFQVNTMSGLGFKYNSIWHAITSIVRQEGLKGMYKGIIPNLLKVAPSMASSWFSYELVKDFLMSLDPKESEL
ncbi:Mitoferrin-2 [Arthrobotrys entomopaga]|nr:Mitoferrin-2 [Arthrobotrys entomopaga]